MLKFEQTKSLNHSLQEDCKKTEFNKDYVEVITSRFDRLFELFWKTLKEYLLKELGIVDARSGSPKEIIQLAYREKLIDDDETMIKMLADRNNDVHLYNEAEAVRYACRIRDTYAKSLNDMIENLQKVIPDEPEGYVSYPVSFLQAFGKQELDFDEFEEKVMRENQFSSRFELCRKWEEVRAKYE